MRSNILSRALANMSKLASLASLAACSVVGAPSAPEPDYSVILAEPPFELRDYGTLTVVKTNMTDGSNAAFTRLFEYISGENTGDREIAMTAPVLSTDRDAGTEISMTAPVLQTRDETREMIFVLPDDMTFETAPEPSDPRVSVATIPPRRVAVIRYSGFLNASAPKQENRLREWMNRKGLQPVGPAEIAGYNPPWTLPAYRRNEVLIPIQ